MAEARPSDLVTWPLTMKSMYRVSSLRGDALPPTVHSLIRVPVLGYRYKIGSYPTDENPQGRNLQEPTDTGKPFNINDFARHCTLHKFFHIIEGIICPIVRRLHLHQYPLSTRPWIETDLQVHGTQVFRHCERLIKPTIGEQIVLLSMGSSVKSSLRVR